MMVLIIGCDGPFRKGCPVPHNGQQAVAVGGATSTTQSSSVVTQQQVVTSNTNAIHVPAVVTPVIQVTKSAISSASATPSVSKCPMQTPTATGAASGGQATVMSVAATESLLRDKMDKLKSEGRYRVFFDIERKAGEFPAALNHSLRCPKGNAEAVTVWCNNDYLSMGQHPVVTGAMKAAIDRSGAGAGGTRNISGTTNHHTTLERELAEVHDKEVTTSPQHTHLTQPHVHCHPFHVVNLFILLV
jgi:hypothetical protein